MQMSSQFCRAQEAQQNQRAADSQLANVRTIALGAAAAWRLEAIAADRRENRHSRITAETAPPQPVGHDQAFDLDFDESS